MIAEPFAAEPIIGRQLFALVDLELGEPDDESPRLVAASPDREHPIPANIVRSGTGMPMHTRVRRIFP